MMFSTDHALLPHLWVQEVAGFAGSAAPESLAERGGDSEGWTIGAIPHSFCRLATPQLVQPSKELDHSRPDEGRWERIYGLP